MAEMRQRDNETSRLRDIETATSRCLLVFISDAHLGSGADSREREQQLCRFLDDIKDDCHTLVLLGDMFDFWFSYRHLVPRGHVRLLGKLAELSDRGVRIHFFIGNHDMWLFDYLEKEMGAVMHDEPEVMEFDGRRFLVGHGDGLGNTDPGFNFIRLFFRSRICQRLFALLPSALMFPIAHRWSDSNKRRHARQDSLRYLGDDREGIVIYCKERLKNEQFDYCVFGHRHTPLTMPLGEGCTYVNVGDWLHNRNYAVYQPKGTLELRDLNS